MSVDDKAAGERQSYILVAGEIVFQMNEDEPPNAIRLNTVVTSRDGRVSVQHIGRAQQALQLQFFKRMGDPNLKVLDVVILAITPLGEFTPEEFNAAPSGTEMRSVSEAGHA
jgi:hypothetical protein